MKEKSRFGIIKWLDLHLEETIMVVLGSLIGIIIMLQIIMRYVFRHALPWPEEFCRFCYIYFCFISIGCSVRNHSMLNVTLLQDHLPRAIRMALDLIIQITMVVVFIVFFRGSLDCVKAAITSGQRSTAMQIPMTVPYMAASIGFFTAVVRSIQASFRSAKMLLSGGDIKVDALSAVEEELDENTKQILHQTEGGG